jgi:hypothetical protein
MMDDFLDFLDFLVFLAGLGWWLFFYFIFSPFVFDGSFLPPLPTLNPSAPSGHTRTTTKLGN